MKMNAADLNPRFMLNKLIYIVDDRMNLCNSIGILLVREGFRVESFKAVKAAYLAFAIKPSDMLIIDTSLAGNYGYSLCESIRKVSSVPIILISDGSSESDIILGFERGADDFFTRPFGLDEFAVKVKSVFRRIEWNKAKIENEHVIEISDVIIDMYARRVKHHGKSIGLTEMEFSLLCYLVRNRNKAVSRRELLNNIWGYNEDLETRAADDMLKRIRRKLLELGSTLRIETIRGYGFRIRDIE